ncbi:transcription factor IIA, alpha/beta subunit [Pyronema omphalodes]|nr:transcription factor IIA, alpha/beta subunit [Pyronema omphalodes]
MSNQLVGQVYSAIIEEVINSSRIDFEEAGINASTLDDLKAVWRNKLSGLKIAQFPWDPAPVPEAPPLVNGAAVSQQQRAQQQQQVHHAQHMVHPQQMQQQMPQQGQHMVVPKQEPYTQLGNAGVKIKTEPGMEQQGVYSMPPAANLTGNPTHDPHLAQMRAQQNIAQKFGPQLQARPASGLVLPGMNPGPPPQTQPQTQTQRTQQSGMPQNDGADDDVILIDGFGSLSREQADTVLLSRINQAERASAKATEDLFQALQNLKTTDPSPKFKVKGKGKSKARRVHRDPYDEALDPNSSYPYPATIEETFPSVAQAPRIPQGDATADSDDENDEDAINSDLDDPEDDEIDNDDEDEVPQRMLCMYDKVQRTKNKWKCVLKDGVLTINGREYVFHKANGEYEW